MENIPLYEAIQQMRQMTAEGKTFTFVHVSYNRDTQVSNGLRVVRKAKVRPAAKSDKVIHSEYKLFYYELDNQQPRVCWQMLILSFEGRKVML